MFQKFSSALAWQEAQQNVADMALGKELQNSTTRTLNFLQVAGRERKTLELVWGFETSDPTPSVMQFLP